MSLRIFAALLPLFLACSGPSDERKPIGSVGNASGNGAANDDNGNADDAGSLPLDGEWVALPTGSREVNGIVNLVNEAASQELLDFIQLEQPLMSILATHSLNAALNLFLEHYVEQYDFVFFLTDHELDTSVIGRFETVTSPVLPGTGSDTQIVAHGYKTNGKVKGVIGVQYVAGGFGPFAHEMLHYWGVRLDEAFGFGVGSDGDHGPHWGYAGVHGQLGGFDPATLRCETPPGAMPPDCTPLANGRSRYRAGSFYPNANGPSAPMAPLELYLMGLLPLNEVPEEMPVLLQAERIADSFDPNTGSVVVEADGISLITASDIVARHGEVPTGADNEQLSAAFVVLTATPAPDSVLDEIATWAAAFGHREDNADITSFQDLTGGRATLNTRLGPRRSASEPPPQVRPPWSCDLIEQDCGMASVGCYLAGLPEQNGFCALSGGTPAGEPCGNARDCAPGLTCEQSDSTGDPMCTPFCDHEDAQSPQACQTVCERTLFLTDPDGNVLSGQCLPP